MNKIVKTLLIVVGILLLIFGLLTIIAKDDKQIKITTTKTIDAPVNQVYDQIRFMKNYPNWSPFKNADPKQKYTVSGNDGNVGATYSWVSVNEEGNGSQTVTELKQNKYVKINCDIKAPFEAKPQFEYYLESNNPNSTTVKQDFNIEMGFPDYIFSYLFGLRKEMSVTNEKGLSLLKNYLEKK